jgi:MFS family permease
MNCEIAYLAITYALIFTGYYTSAGFLTILYPNYAFISFAIFFAMYAISSSIAPYIISRVNIRLAICVSAFSFTLYVGFSSSKMVTLLLIGSAITGGFNGIIWLSQGVWMLKYPEDIRGTLIGWFFGIFSSNIIIGNLLAIIVLIINITVQDVIFIMTGITCLGFIMSIFIPPFSCNTCKKPENQTQTPLLGMLKDVFTIITINKGYLLIPLYITQSMDLNITFQILTRLLIINANNNTLEAGVYNGAIYLAYGVGAIVFAICWGKIFDKFGWKPVMFSYLGLQMGCLMGMILLAKFSARGPLGLWIILSTCKGIIDNATNTIINISISNTFQQKANLMFAFYRFTYAIGYVCFSLMVGYVSYEWVLLTDGLLVILSVVCYCFFVVPNIQNSLEQQFDNNAIMISEMV